MTWSKDKCTNGGSEHKFQPRYNESPNPNWRGGEFWWFSANEIRDCMILKIYICDVCEWCGKTVKVEK